MYPLVQYLVHPNNKSLEASIVGFGLSGRGRDENTDMLVVICAESIGMEYWMNTRQGSREFQVKFTPRGSMSTTTLKGPS